MELAIKCNIKGRISDETGWNGMTEESELKIT